MFFVSLSLCPFHCEEEQHSFCHIFLGNWDTKKVDFSANDRIKHKGFLKNNEAKTLCKFVVQVRNYMVENSIGSCSESLRAHKCESRKIARACSKSAIRSADKLFISLTGKTQDTPLCFESRTRANGRVESISATSIPCDTGTVGVFWEPTQPCNFQGEAELGRDTIL